MSIYFFFTSIFLSRYLKGTLFRTYGNLPIKLKDA